ncbi:hypothetical protein XELAEV_18015598mg [Xenopus laevis]|uniref:Uncharacterized protein n=1 Tax=Xenopus laevis TaxID=8355 RepID=A0A974DIZ2_XENLA|nr:hypothetical protein XELAEV_18015598mg [Xenopus laevis]
MTQGDQVLTNKSCFPCVWLNNSSIFITDPIFAHHSVIVGGMKEQQCQGMTALAALRLYPISDFLCLVDEPGSMESKPTDSSACKVTPVSRAAIMGGQGGEL